jgi:hypothetical protein
MVNAIQVIFPETRRSFARSSLVIEDVSKSVEDLSERRESPVTFDLSSIASALGTSAIAITSGAAPDIVNAAQWYCGGIYGGEGEVGGMTCVGVCTLETKSERARDLRHGSSCQPLTSYN